MGVGEIAYRTRTAVHQNVEKLGIGLRKTVDKSSGISVNVWQSPPTSSVDTNHYLTAADFILKGEFSVFSKKQMQLGFPPNWNLDPKTKTVAPLEFGKTLNYRDESIVGNIKYLWEPNRQLELVTMAQAFHLSGDLKYAKGCRVLLESWFKQCPYPLGVNWLSSLEHSVRLLNWSFAWHLLDCENSSLFSNEDGESFLRRWQDSIYQHCYFISGHFSFYSSANNHLLGEYMGLYVASTTWPLWKESAKWKQLAKQGFQREALKQNFSDGVNREQGIWYHHEVADMILFCGLIGRVSGDEFCPEYWLRLEAMLEYIASIMNYNGNIPMFGDSDDAVMVRFSQEPDFDVYRSLLATGAILFNRSDFKAKAERVDDKTHWLLGDNANEQFNEIPNETKQGPVRYSFPEGGYSILGHNFESPNEVRIIVDAGPLGYLSIAAHGHADALSFTLSVGGNEVLIDPGTYAYHTHQKWRDYFRGTSAHNTIMVDSEDQSVSGGNFLWLKHAESECLEFSRSNKQDVWMGAHDGYHRLKDRVNHQRQLTFEKISNLVKVVDLLTCNGSHYIDLHWHFAETCFIKIKESCVQILTDKVMVTMSMPEIDWQPQAIVGQEDPPLGWISRRFDEKQPVTTVRWSGSITGSIELTTIIQIEFIEEQCSSENKPKA